MSLLRAIIGGFLGATIGAAIWIAVGQFAGYEVGLVAIAVGFLTGFGVKKACEEWEVGQIHGIVAGVLAMVAIVGAKYTMASNLAIQARQAILEYQPTRDELVSCVAAGIVKEIQSQGQPAGPADVDSGSKSANPSGPRSLPPTAESSTEVATAGADTMTAQLSAKFAAPIWQVATELCDQWSTQERDKYVSLANESRANALGFSPGLFTASRKEIANTRFYESFGYQDLLWMALAFGAAFRLGSTESGEYEDELDDEE